MFKINFKNTAENLGIMIIAFIVGGTVGYFASTFANKQSNKHYELIIREAIQKETTSIKNELTTNFEKKSLKKAEGISIVIDPTNNSIISTSDTTGVVEQEAKKGLIKRIVDKIKRKKK